MSTPPFVLAFSDEASSILDDLQSRKGNATQYKTVRKALRQLRDAGSGYPALHSHNYESLNGPNGEDVWESYVENRTPGAWRGGGNGGTTSGFHVATHRIMRRGRRAE